MLHYHPSVGGNSYTTCGQTATTASCSTNGYVGTCGLGCPSNSYCQCSLSSGGNQYADFSASGAYIVLSYTLYSEDGSTLVTGSDGNAVTVSVTINYEGDQPSGSITNGNFCAYYTDSDNLPSGSSFSLSTSGSGFSLAYSE